MKTNIYETIRVSDQGRRQNDIFHGRRRAHVVLFFICTRQITNLGSRYTYINLNASPVIVLPSCHTQIYIYIYILAGQPSSPVSFRKSLVFFFSICLFSLTLCGKPLLTLRTFETRTLSTLQDDLYTQKKTLKYDIVWLPSTWMSVQEVLNFFQAYFK